MSSTLATDVFPSYDHKLDIVRKEKRKRPERCKRDSPVPSAAFPSKQRGINYLLHSWHNNLSCPVHSSFILEPRHAMWFPGRSRGSFGRYRCLIVERLARSLCDCRNSRRSTDTILSLPFCRRLLWLWSRGFRVNDNDLRRWSIFVEIGFFVRDPICCRCSVRRLSRLCPDAADSVDTV